MSNRVEKINELIKREMGQIIMKEIDVPENSLVTISRVKTSSNMNETMIWLSVFPSQFTEEILKQIINKIWHLQKLLNRRLVMRYIPKIRFTIDPTEEQAGEVEEILGNIKS